MGEGLSHHRHPGIGVTLVGAAANVGLIGLKLAGGFWAGSQALIADGLHSISDLLSDVVVLLGLTFSVQAEDEHHPFGHGRIETLSAFIVGALVFATGIGIGWAAASDLYHGSVSRPHAAGLLVAAVSIVCKEALYRYTAAVGRRLNSPALESNAWHHRSDAFSSVAVLVGVAVAVIDPRWGAADQWAALVVSALILKVGISFVVSALKEFIDTAPEKHVVKGIRSCARDVDGVLDVHDVRARTSGGKVFVEIHVTVDGDMTVRAGHDVAKAVELCLVREVTNLSKAIVHVDPGDEEETP